MSRIEPSAERVTPQQREFGGAVGTLAILIASHLFLYYLWLSLTYHRGAPFAPQSLGNLGGFFRMCARQIAAGAAPSWHAAAIYLGFIAFEFVLAAIMPGVRIKGLPVRSEGGVRHTYLCNGAASWYVTLVVVAILHVTGWFRLERIAAELGPLLTVAVLFADGVAVATYVLTIAAGRQVRMSGNVIYDFFMGAVLNPRVGVIDLKFFTEIRVSWILLFLLTLGAAAKQVAQTGSLSASMIFMIVAHGLYTNACMKGEECIPTTWDIFHEKWGWMLIFWNLVGVPWFYSFNAYYLVVADSRTPSAPIMTVLFVALLCAYYVWDTAQSQKNRFRMQERGSFIRRRTFPQLPWGTLKNPRFLTAAGGGTLLVDGWWAYARKIHYTADIVMASSWALCCGFGSPLPYIYPLFFFVMILHRARRDETRCRAKYGADWDRYLAVVPYRFIPFLI